MEITESNKPRSLTFLLSTLALCMPALAQRGASAGVYGSVLDSQGAVITGAKVTLLHVTTNQARTAVTNETGEFLFPLRPQLSLPNGTIRQQDIREDHIDHQRAAHFATESEGGILAWATTDEDSVAWP